MSLTLAGKIIMVVEDDNKIREIIVELLLKEGVNEVAPQWRVHMALTCLTLRHFDAVLTDWDLYGLKADGIVRECERLFVPVVVFTGDHEDVCRYVRCPVLAKPNVKEIPAYLSYALNGGRGSPSAAHLTA